MLSDEFVCIKILKLKLLSNIITFFVIDDSQNSDKTTEIVSKMLDTILANKHWPVLNAKSEQFKPEKARL